MTEWRSIPDAEMYEVSDDGRIRSWKIQGDKMRRRAPQPRYMTMNPKADGYCQFKLTYNDGVRRDQRLHELVLLAFVGPRPDGLVGCHFDGDKSNNVLSNLRWDTQASNIKDSVRHGTFQRGETHSNARITDAQVREIREKYARGNVTQQALADEYGVRQNYVSAVVLNQKRVS